MLKDTARKLIEFLEDVFRFLEIQVEKECSHETCQKKNGMDSEACEHALMAADVSFEEAKQNLLCGDVVGDSSLGSECVAFASDLVSCEPFSLCFSSQLDSSPSRQLLDLSLCEFKQAREIAPPQCLKPIDAAINGSSQFANCTSTVCSNASINSACLDNQIASLQQPPSFLVFLKAFPMHIDDVSKAAVMSEDGSFVTLNMEYVHANLVRLERGLVGKLFGCRLPFFVLRNELKRKWSIFGEFQLISGSPNAFICLFESVEAQDAILLVGSWVVGGFIISLDRWSYSFSPQSLVGLSSPVWIRLPSLPLLYWDNTNLARIASFFGQPLWVDAQTNSWGRNAFA
ncbi:hypothetical protein M5K25_028385 [Dendrobium thyrsiflorum]|uniref:DUF4283 domain-containing protein n=1 Tax=Dendrobium thyrsiflorum TaxID=117978 RepID=A0ABD0TTE5_DENTH